MPENARKSQNLHPPMESVSAPGTLQSLQRGLDVLDLVVQAREPLRLADIARQLDMDRASVFRFMRTLAHKGLVTQDPTHKKYSVGGRLMQWAMTIEQDANLVVTARPYLEQLVANTNESGHFGVLSKDRALLLDYIGSRGTIVVQNRVGVFEPLYCTALGKALLAFQSKERQEALIAGMTLERYTESTVADRVDLRNVLGTVRANGVAYDDGEYNGVLFCIAAPVLGCDGSAIGAIGVSMVRPLVIKEPERIARVASEVRAAAEAMTAALAGGPDLRLLISAEN